ncbi:MAG: hypothetical protein LBT65_08610 [Synergistaceae bacterium]|jgi:hypothetical protein|nr:hypothetical protein [Synergistaceae bacterium]
MPKGKHETEEEGYWNSGQHGNQDEYERYLLIREQIEGDGRHSRGKRKRKTSERGKVVSLLSYYPAMRWALVLLLLVNVTHVMAKFQLHQKFFVLTALYWCALSVVICWYFALRDAGYGSLALVDHFLADLPFPRSLPMWGFLLGWILSTLDPNDFKAWVSPIEILFRWLHSPFGGAAFLSRRLPRVPLLIRMPASLMMIVCGVVLVMDIAAAPWLKKMSD